MGKAKRALSVIMAALMLVFTCMTYVPTFAAENTSSAPEVAFVGVDHSPLVVGDTEGFSITTKNADKVQYNVVLKDATGKVVEDLTKGYTAETAGNVPFELKATTVFALGHYNLAVEAKRVSDGKVATYSASLNCVTKDDANRVYANGAMVTDKDSYVVGEKVTVSEVKGLAGIAGPYKYRLHVYNATTGTWTKNAVANYGDKVEWTPTAPGTYVLDVHVNTEKSTTWAKYSANPTSEDVYGTYEAWKLKTIVVTDKLAVTKVTAPSKNTVVVTFNQNVGTVVPSNFTVAEKDDEYALSTIESVKVVNNVVTVKLADDLSDDTVYTLAAKNVPSFDGKLTLDASKTEFTYKEVATPASIALTTTKFETEEDLLDSVVIKDKDGNDITENFDTITFESSDDTVVDSATGKTTDKAGYAIVNVVVTYGDDEDTLETGATLVQVFETLNKLTSIGKYTLVKGDATPDYDDPTTSLFKSDKDADMVGTYTLKYEVLDQDGDDFADYDVVSYRSLNPSIVQVNENGQITPFATGTATVVVKLVDKNDDDITVSKAFTITVKADPKATSLKLNATSFKLDKDVQDTDAIYSTLKVTVLDQYGEAFYDADATVNVKASKSDVVNALQKSTDEALTYNEDDEAYELTMLAGTADATSTVLTVTDDTLKTTATVTTVSGGTDVVGYIVEADSTKIDANATARDDDDDNYFGPQKAQISVYGKNKAGNKITDETANATYTDDTDSEVLSVDATGAVTPGDEVGTEAVTVKMNNVSIGKVTFTVKDTTPVITKIVQKKEVITVADGANALDSMFKYTTDDDGVVDYDTDSAFVAYDQFGDEIAVTADDVQAMTTNTAVVGTDLAVSADTDAATVTVTLLINDELVQVITVKVPAADAE